MVHDRVVLPLGNAEDDHEHQRKEEAEERRYLIPEEFPSIRRAEHGEYAKPVAHQSRILRPVSCRNTSSSVADSTRRFQRGKPPRRRAASSASIPLSNFSTWTITSMRAASAWSG